MDEIQRWIALFPEQEVRKRVAAREADLSRLMADLTKDRDALMMFERLRDVYEANKLAAAHADEVRPPNLRAAIVAVLQAEPRDWRPQEIRDALARQGFLTNDEKGMTRLFGMLSDMVRKHEVAKSGKGLYRRPDPGPVPIPGSPVASGPA